MTSDERCAKFFGDYPNLNTVEKRVSVRQNITDNNKTKEFSQEELDSAISELVEKYNIEEYECL